MKFKQSIIISLAVVGLGVYACEKRPQAFENFKEVKALPIKEYGLSVNVHPLDEIEILDIRNIININDEYLVILSDTPKGIFKVFSLPELNYLYSWGRKGRGPGELSTVSYGSSLIARHNKLLINDPNLFIINKYMVTDTGFVFDKRITLPHRGKPLNDIMKLSDSLFVAENRGFLSDKPYVALSPYEEKVLFYFGKYPETEMKLKGLMRFQKFSKIPAAKPNGSKFIAFYENFDMFKIFDNEGNTLKVLKIKDTYYDYLTRRPDVRATNKQIYVLSFNVTDKEFEENPRAISSVIEIWNWKGEPIDRFKLPKSIHRFAISEKYQTIYGVSVFQADKIYSYDLSSRIIDDQVQHDIK